MKNTFNVIHLESSQVLRDAIKGLLSFFPEFKLVSIASTNDLPLDSGDDNIFVIDDSYARSQHGSIQFWQYLVQDFPKASVLLHSTCRNPDAIANFLNKGVSGFVTKFVGWDELMEGIVTIAEGSRFVSSDIACAFVNTKHFMKGGLEPLKPVRRLFSQRETDVLSYIMKGFSTKQIANVLEISLKTVETHRKNLLKKANVSNTSALISFAYMKDYLWSIV